MLVFFLKFNFKKPLLEGLCRSNLSAEWAGLGSKDVWGGVWLLHQITDTRFCFDITHHTVTSLPPGQSTAVDLCVPVAAHHHHQHFTHVTHQHHHIQGLRAEARVSGWK